MNMIDYKLLEALSMVNSEKGFEKAAAKLFITQSAVSQRIGQLEKQAGQVLVTRTTPPRLTEAGKRYVTHYNRVKHLEDDFFDEIEGGSGYMELPVGINVDSLSGWFLPAVMPFLKELNILLELKVDDQEHTLELLKNGEVAGCISAVSRPVQGCSVHPLGAMEYCMAATRSFRKKWFPGGFVLFAVEKAPAVIFNRKDNLHSVYLRRLFGEDPALFPVHHVPSSEKYIDLILNDLAYGVVPVRQFGNLPEKNRLIELASFRLSVPLFWHHWNIRSERLDALTKIVIAAEIG